MNEEPGHRSKRLFVGITLPTYIVSEIDKLTEPLPGFRWMANEQRHVTLKFIGDAGVGDEEAIRRVLGVVRVEPFFLAVDGVGCFPGRGRPGILWAGLGKGHPRLFQLHKKVEDGLYGIGFIPENRTFHPHITLARCKEAAPGSVFQFVKDHRDFTTAPFKVEGFNLYSSQLHSTGSTYTVEEHWSLVETQPS